MTTVTKVNPYEFLVRWNPDSGKFQGYHFKTITRTWEEDQIIASGESGAMNAETAAKAGFPITDILQIIQTDALTAVDEARAERDAGIKAAEEAKTLAISLAQQEKIDAIEDAEKSKADAIAQVLQEKADALAATTATIAELTKARDDAITANVPK